MLTTTGKAITASISPCDVPLKVLYICLMAEATKGPRPIPSVTLNTAFESIVGLSAAVVV